MDTEKDHGLIFSAAEIREKGGLTVRKVLDADIFAETLDAPAKVERTSIELIFSVGGESLLLEGEIKAGIGMDCARCGARFNADFSETFDEVYEDAVESIDVRGLLVESVALMMPLKPLCSEGCKGLCQVCGADLNRKSCGCVTARDTEVSGAKGDNPFGALKDLPIKQRLKDQENKKTTGGKPGKKRPK